MTKSEFAAMVQDFINSPLAEPWPGLRAKPEITCNADQTVWMQDGTCDDGPVYFVLHRGEIYVMEC